MATVQVLLAVFNGALFLQEQLDSISAQSLPSIDILASDDGSTDGSMDILLAAQKSWTKGVFTIISGPQDGFAKNFRRLILQSSDNADHYAFCDQDDIWLPLKLEKAVTFCPNAPGSKSRVFASRTALIDKDGVSIGLSPLHRRPAGFRHAVLQNVASGNTMVMNKAARQLLVETAENIAPLSHDHWLYLITTANGGHFHYDEQPTVLYRQHENNAIGIKNKPFWERHAWRFNRYMTGAVRKKTSRCLTALDNCSGYLTDEAKEVLLACQTLHSADSAISRIRALRASGIYRATHVGQIGLWIDSLFKLR